MSLTTAQQASGSDIGVGSCGAGNSASVTFTGLTTDSTATYECCDGYDGNGATLTCGSNSPSATSAFALPTSFPKHWMSSTQLRGSDSESGDAAGVITSASYSLY